MSYTAVATDFYHSLDVDRNVTTEVTLYNVVVFDFITELGNVIFCEILAASIRIDTGLFKDFVRGCSADTVDIGKTDFNSLLIRNFNTSYTCHSGNTPPFSNCALTLFLLVLGVFANYHNMAFSLDNFAFIANLFNGRFNFHVYYTVPFIRLIFS